MNRLALRGLMLTLLIVGTGLVSLNILKGWLLVAHQSEKIEVISQVETIEPKFEAIEPVNLSTVLQNPPTVNQAIGTLVIPDLQMNLPVFAGMEAVDLLTGGGTMFPERNPKNNNFVIIGHHVGYSELLFGGLGQLEKGATILLHHLGQDYQYEVAENQVISQTELSVLDESNRGELTLITCDQAGATQQRIMIKAAGVQTAEVQSIQDHQVGSQRKIPMKLVGQTAIVLLLFLVLLSIILSVTKKSK